MGPSVELQISAPRDVSQPYDDPPTGVTVLRARKTMGFGGLDVLALDVLIEVGKAALPALATWLFDTYRSREPEAPSMQIVINGDVHVAGDAEDLLEVLQQQEAT
jgi:hypothetical protein